MKEVVSRVREAETGAEEARRAAAQKAKEAETAAEKPSTTFWDRVSRMFQDFWQAIAGIFR